MWLFEGRLVQCGKAGRGEGRGWAPSAFDSEPCGFSGDLEEVVVVQELDLEFKRCE